MKNKNILIKNLIQKKYINNSQSITLNKKFDKIFENILYNLTNIEKTINVLSNKFKLNFKEKDLKSFKRFNEIVIIGMGGSALGSEAIYNFFESKIKKKIYFLNDINSDSIIKLKKKKFNKTLFIIISKSGNTIETLSNSLSLNLFKKKKKNIIIISEKKNNFLYDLSKKFNLFFIEHNKFIGGRYSVLSEVGIIPAILMGLNGVKLRKNVEKYINLKSKKSLKKVLIPIANLLKKKKMNNLIFLNYSPKLEKFLFWCQQLIAESLGKKGYGFLPTISNAPKDHHSLLQLYLDGPNDKIFYIFSLDRDLDVKIKNINSLKNFHYLNKKTLEQIKQSQKKAIMQVFKKNKIPFREFCVKRINEETLGEFFSFFIIETIILGKLIGVNPFSQPAVEQVKTLTKKILK